MKSSSKTYSIDNFSLAEIYKGVTPALLAGVGVEDFFGKPQ
jgi:hypothetical protein